MQHFPKYTLLFVAAINLIDTGDQILGNNTQLFQCNSIQTLTLNGTLKDTTYTMYMDMTNTQIQAFDIKNGKLSSDGELF